jgi:hypothetical protein
MGCVMGGGEVDFSCYRGFLTVSVFRREASKHRLGTEKSSFIDIFGDMKPGVHVNAPRCKACCPNASTGALASIGIRTALT